MVAPGALDHLTQVAGALGEHLSGRPEHVFHDDLEGAAGTHEALAHRGGKRVSTGPDQGDRRRHPWSSLRTRAALPRRNFGHTSSLKPTLGMSVMMRSIDRPIG